jgi:hypothetical protein
MCLHAHPHKTSDSTTLESNNGTPDLDLCCQHGRFLLQQRRICHVWFICCFYAVGYLPADLQSRQTDRQTDRQADRAARQQDSKTEGRRPITLTQQSGRTQHGSEHSNRGRSPHSTQCMYACMYVQYLYPTSICNPLSVIASLLALCLVRFLLASICHFYL